MALKIVWTRNTQKHLKDILTYWEVRTGSNLYSLKLNNLFQNSLSILAKQAEIGCKTNNSSIRKKTLGDYFLYYSFDESNLTILAIVDMRRNPKFIRMFED